MVPNIALIIIAFIAVGLTAVGMFYILVYFQHEEDKNTAIFPKIVVVVGLTVTCVNILMLPFDVANTRLNGGIPMDIIWIIDEVFVTVMAVGVLPFSVFYYEAEDPDTSNAKQIRTAIIYEVITAVIFMVIAVILWITVGIAEVPVNILTSNLSSTTDLTECLGCTSSSGTINYRVTFFLYVISLINLAGVVIFVVFGGIGLAALPMDLINGFRKRPKRIDLKTFILKKKELSVRSEALLAQGKALDNKFKANGGRAKNRAQRTEYNKFRASVYILEEDFNTLNNAYGRGVGPRILMIVWDYCKLVLGIVGIVISICWFIHIVIYMAPHPPIYGFLNNFFTELDSGWQLFGTLAYAIFSFYLLWCVIKGDVKFGLRVPLIFEIHPMKVNGTLMNAFLFNTLLLILASETVIQFCSDAFSSYARFSSSDILFNIGLRNMIGISYIWNYYYFFFLGFAFISAVYLLLWPSDRKRLEKGFLARDPKKSASLP